MAVGLSLLMAACTASASMEMSGELPPAAPILGPASSLESPAETPSSLTDLVIPTEVPVDECLECHLDKQRLMDTAEPEVVVESESEGEG